MRPAFQITVGRTSETGDRPLQFLIHVQQRRRSSNTGADRKRQTMRLPGTVVGILSKDHDLDITQFGEAKRIKHIFLRRINRDPGLTLSGDGMQRIDKVGLLFLFSQHIVPG